MITFGPRQGGRSLFLGSVESAKPVELTAIVPRPAIIPLRNARRGLGMELAAKLLARSLSVMRRLSALNLPDFRALARVYNTPDAGKRFHSFLAKKPLQTFVSYETKVCRGLLDHVD